MGNKASSPKQGKSKSKSQHDIKAQQSQQAKTKSSSKSPSGGSNGGSNGSSRRPSLASQQSQSIPSQPQQPLQQQQPPPPPPPPVTSIHNPEDNAPIEAAVEEIPYDQDEDDGPEVVNLTAEPVMVPIDDPSIIATVVTAETIYLSNVEKQHVERLVADGMTETDALQFILSKRETENTPRGAVTAPTVNAQPTNPTNNNLLSQQQQQPQQPPQQSAGIAMMYGSQQPSPVNTAPMAMSPPSQQPSQMLQAQSTSSMVGIAANQSMYHPNPAMMYGNGAPVPSQSFYIAGPPSISPMYDMSMVQPTSQPPLAPPLPQQQSMYDMSMLAASGYPPAYPPHPAPQPMSSAYGSYYAAPPPPQHAMYDPNMQSYYQQPPPGSFYGGIPPTPMPSQYPPPHPNGPSVSGISYVPMTSARRESLSSRVSVSSGDSISDSGASHLSGRVKVNDIKKLTKMGFKREDVIQALLRTNNDTNRSTELLLEWQRSGRR